MAESYNVKNVRWKEWNINYTALSFRSKFRWYDYRINNGTIIVKFREVPILVKMVSGQVQIPGVLTGQ